MAPATIRVLVRVRPLSNSELTDRGSIGRTKVVNYDKETHGDTISIANIANDSDRSLNSESRFVMDAILGETSTQSEVYDSVKGIVDAFTSGYNGTIVAYGQAGSGKTHTVFGSGSR